MSTFPTKREAREVLDSQVEWIEGAGGTVVGAQLRGGGPVDEILDLVEELGANLVVMVRRRRARSWSIRAPGTEVIVCRALKENPPLGEARDPRVWMKDELAIEVGGD